MRGKARLVVLSVTATVAGVLAVAALSQAPTSAAPAQTGITRQVLQTVEVPGSNYQVVEARVAIAANSRIPRHTHPGTVIGYLLAGDYSIQLDGQKAKSVAPGATFVVPGGVAHEELTGAHAATVIAVFTVEKGKPLSSPAP